MDCQENYLVLKMNDSDASTKTHPLMPCDCVNTPTQWSPTRSFHPRPPNMGLVLSKEWSNELDVFLLHPPY